MENKRDGKRGKERISKEISRKLGLTLDRGRGGDKVKEEEEQEKME